MTTAPFRCVPHRARNDARTGAVRRSLPRRRHGTVTALVALGLALTTVVPAVGRPAQAAATAEQMRVSWTGGTSTTLTIRWRADDPGAGSRARFRPAGATTWTTVTGSTVGGTTASGTHHEVTLTGLGPDTDYQYQVAAGATAWSATRTTATAPSGGSFRTAFVADTGIAGRRDGLATGTEAVIENIAAADPLLVLGGGDYAYFDTEDRVGTLDEAIDLWTAQMTPLISEAAFMPTFGNHEVLLGEDVATWTSRFATPGGLDSEGIHYSFDVAGVHFVSITAPVGWLPSKVVDWLEADLDAAVAAGARAIVPYLHHHAYGDGTVHPAPSSLGDQLNPIFEEHGIQVVLTAHDQAYERTFPLRSGNPSTSERSCYTPGAGVTWVKTSPGGKLSNLSWDFSPFDASPSPRIASRNNSLHHYTLLDFGSGSDVEVTTYGLPGDATAPVVVDRFEYASSCGNRVGITSMPVSVTVDHGDRPVFATVSATATGASTIGLTDTASWLTTPTSLSTGATGIMKIDPTGLAPGTYVAELTASAGGASDMTSVTMKVRGDTSGATLEVSSNPDRSGRVPLHGAVLSGDAYVVLTPEAGSTIGQVRFMLDGGHKRTETNEPYDLRGGGTPSAVALDTTTLPDGDHQVDAVIVAPDGSVELAAATFRVDNVLSPDDFDVMVSERADRTGAVQLDEWTVDGDVFVFTTPVTGVASVQFYVDDPAMSGAPVRTDTDAPFDLVGGDATAAAAFDTETLSDGRHTVTARITTDEGATATTATFTVVNAGSQPPGDRPSGGSSDLVALTPARLADSRPDHHTIDGSLQGFGRQPAGSITTIPVTGRAGVPADATAALLNVTAVRPDATGYLTVFPCGEPTPTTSNVNYTAGQIEPNAVLAKIGTNGAICIYTHADTHLVVDVNGVVT
jgi:hypothetical protein